MVQNDKKALLCLISQEPYIIWSSFMVHVWRKIISLCLLLHFSEILFFGVSSGVKGQKMAQNDKKIVCRTPYLRKHTSYDCDFWYPFEKRWYLQMLFSFFQNVDFLGCSGAKRAKNDQFISLYLKNCRSYHQDF